MTRDELKKRFTVISNPDVENNTTSDDRYRKRTLQSYQTNPLKEQFMRFTNEEVGRKFSVEDLLKW